MREPKSVVLVVDDDPSFRRSVARLIRTSGVDVQTFGSAEEFLASRRPDIPSCLVLDVRLGGANGLELQRQLTRSGVHLPIVFITAHGDIPMSVQAMKAGAVEFLTKPFRPPDLLHAVNEAIKRANVTRDAQSKLAELLSHYNLLTRREREVMARVVAGKLNKQIAAELGTTEKTIKFHRAHMMQKMVMSSVADLVRAATILGLQS
jgi:FixJ family two-component response regulator